MLGAVTFAREFPAHLRPAGLLQCHSGHRHASPPGRSLRDRAGPGLRRSGVHLAGATRRGPFCLPSLQLGGARPAESHQSVAAGNWQRLLDQPLSDHEWQLALAKLTGSAFAAAGFQTCVRLPIAQVMVLGSRFWRGPYPDEARSPRREADPRRSSGPAPAACWLGPASVLCGFNFGPFSAARGRLWSAHPLSSSSRRR